MCQVRAGGACCVPHPAQYRPMIMLGHFQHPDWAGCQAPSRIVRRRPSRLPTAQVQHPCSMLLLADPHQRSVAPPALSSGIHPHLRNVYSHLLGACVESCAPCILTDATAGQTVNN